MPASRQNIVEFLDRLLLEACPCQDSSHNGLQVEGKDDVKNVIFAVDASQQLFDAAAELQADMILVHHGISWGDSLNYLTNLNAARLRTLFKNNISLYAAHLPLDMHPRVGHNAVIAERLGITERQPFFTYHNTIIGWSGVLPHPLTNEQMLQQVNDSLNCDAVLLPFGRRQTSRLGIVSGGGGDAIQAAALADLDCLITGEMNHVHYHIAKETGINVIAAGHYKSEVPGLEAVMAELQKQFPILCQFLDLPTGY